MKMKKIIAIILTAFAVFTMSFSVLADSEELYYSAFKNNSGLTFEATDGCSIGTGKGLSASVKGKDGAGGSAIAKIGDTDWQDYSFETTFTVNQTKNADDRIVVIFKNKSQFNKYGLVFSVQNGRMYVQKDSVNYFTSDCYTLGEIKAEILKDKENSLKVSSVGNKLTVILNNETILDFTDLDEIKFGSMALGAATGGNDTFNVSFSRLTVNGETRTLPKITGTTAGNKTLFFEDFERNLNNWDISGTGGISELDGMNMLNLGDGKSVSSAFLNTGNYDDICLDYYVKSNSDYSIYARYAGVNLFYCFDFSPENGGTVKIVKKVDNDEKVLGSAENIKENFGADINEFNLMRIILKGENLGVFYDSQKKSLVTVTDTGTGILSGKIAFTAYDAYFDDISVNTAGSSVNPADLHPIKPIDKAQMNDNDETDNIYKELYVSENGDDNNDGSNTAPFKTIGRAAKEVEKLNSAMTGNIVINVQSGLYELSEPIKITNENSGKNGYYVIFRSVGGRSTVTAGHKITGTWEHYTDKIYKIPVKSTYETGFKEFYVNGERKARAGIYEMNPEFFAYDDPETTAYGFEADGLYISKALLPELAHPEDLEWIANTAWRSFHIPVLTQETSKIDENYWDLKMQNPSFGHSYVLGPDGANTRTHRSQRIRIENALELLDEPGEWYYDKREGMMYYYPDSYEDINTAQCYIPGIDRVLEIFGNSTEDRAGNVTFSGFDFCNTGWEYMTKYGYVTNQTPFPKDTADTLKEMDTQYAVKIQNADNLKFYDNKFTNLGGSGIHFTDAVNNVSFTGNVIDDVADTGIAVGHVKSGSMVIQWDKLTAPDNIYIANNIINDIGAEYHAGIGLITTYATHVWILHNEISNIGLNPLSLGWGWSYPAKMDLNTHCTMYNVLRDYNYKQLLHDLAACYMLSAQQESVIAENYFVNDFGGSYGAIYYDQGASYVLAEQNVIKDVNASVFILSQERHDNLAINNYTTDDGVTNSGMDSYVLDLKKIENYSWPSNAQRIIKNAGLTDDYEYIRNYRSNASNCLDNCYKLTAYKDNSSKVLRFGALMDINHSDDSVKAKIINGKLYLPKEEVSKVCFTKIPSFLGADMQYNENAGTVVCSFTKNSGADPSVLTAPVGSSEWTVDGAKYVTDSPVIVENGKAYISIEDVFKCFGIAKTVSYDGNIAAIAEKGFAFNLSDNKAVTDYITARITK